jgi:hypothetical protein
MKGGVDQNLLNYTFAPSSPASWKLNPNEWLSGTDITRVMRQYENTYPCFQFLGPSPIDYDTHKAYGECVWEELCHFNLSDKIRDGKKKLGIIFNMDPHTKGGSHWVSLFVDLNPGKKFIFYMDSNGEKIPKRIHKLVKTIQKQAASAGVPLEFIENMIEHQRGDTECGMYSLYTIIQLLKNTRSLNYFTGQRIPDKHVEKFRKEYFNAN